MFVIDKSKKIILTKGDTATIYVEVKDLDGNSYEWVDGDIVTLTVKKTPSSDVSLHKVATDDHYIIIDHDDTSNLKPGLYVYDVQLQSGNNIYTIVPMSYFELRNEVSK